MAATVLTDDLVKKLKPRDDDGKAKANERRDKTVPGFIVRAQPSGRKYFYASYKRLIVDKDTDTKSMKATRACLGRADHISVADARALAKVVLSSASLAARRGLTGDRVKDHVSRALLNLDESVEDIEIEAAKQDSCPTLDEFIDNVHGPSLETETKYAKNGRETKRLKFLFGLFSSDQDLDLLNMKVNKISYTTMKKWYLARSNKKVESTGKKPSSSTIQRDLACTSGVFRSAIDHELITINPVAKIRHKARPNTVVRYLGSNESDPKEEERLLKALVERERIKREKRTKSNQWAQERGYKVRPVIPDDHFVDYLRPLVMLALNTGLRRSELLTLKWKYMKIGGSINDYHYLRIPGRLTKNGDWNDVPLNPFITKVLRKWKKQCATIDGEAYVFQGRNGKRINGVRSSWKALLEMAGIKDFRFHDMRHHFASMLVMQGQPLNTVRELLNHRDLQMTLRYAHLAPDHKRDSVNTLATDEKKWIV
jgi:integrase